MDATNGRTCCAKLRCSFHSQKVHAQPRFDPEGMRLPFISDKNGYGILYPGCRIVLRASPVDGVCGSGSGVETDLRQMVKKTVLSMWRGRAAFFYYNIIDEQNSHMNVVGARCEATEGVANND